MDKPKRKLRLIFNSNAQWSKSGYGQQMAELLPYIVKEGFPVAMVAFYGLEGGTIELDGVKCYPKIRDMWGADAILNHQKDFNADVAFTLQDLWVVHPKPLNELKRFIPICPIDHEHVPPAILNRLKMAYRIVTYSKFGYNELKSKGLHSTYIPHTVNTKLLKPSDKLEAKKRLNIPPELFIFGMVAANKDNPSRKSFQQCMDAFKLFHDKHPKSGMYFHTILNLEGGFNIKEYAVKLGIHNFIFSLPDYDQMYKVRREDMYHIYNAMDVLLNPSSNEGFGVPIIEAQSCQVPVIVNNFTAMPELVEQGKTGYITEIGDKRFTALGEYVALPDTTSIYEKMELLFKDDREKMGKYAREQMIENYDTERVFYSKWLPFLLLLEQEIYGKPNFPNQKT